MNILFLTVSTVHSLSGRSIYIDLLKYMRDEGHQVHIVTPLENRFKDETMLVQEQGAKILKIPTVRLKKTNFFEKGFGYSTIEYQYLKGIKKYFGDVKFDLVLYSTPPISFFRVIDYIKKKDGAYSYLLLKDILPQNAVDMGKIKEGSLLHRVLRRKEKKMYSISDTIGCMSEANKQYLIKNNPEIDKRKIEVNPNSITPVPGNVSDMEKRKIRKKYRIPLDRIVFVYGGNLGIPQGIDFLLEVIGSLKEEKAFILVIGTGTEFNKIRKWFQDVKPNNAMLLRGLPKKEYDQLLISCDVGLLFLHKDFTIPNFPSRLLSYLEMRLPVLAATDPNSDVGKVIEQARCGKWVLAGDNSKMQSTISEFCRNQDRFLRMKDNAWKLLQKEYLVENSYKLIIDKV